MTSAIASMSEAEFLRQVRDAIAPWDGCKPANVAAALNLITDRLIEVSRSERTNLDEAARLLGERVDALVKQADQEGYTRKGADLAAQCKGMRDAFDLVVALKNAAPQGAVASAGTATQHAPAGAAPACADKEQSWPWVCEKCPAKTPDDCDHHPAECQGGRERPNPEPISTMPCPFCNSTYAHKVEAKFGKPPHVQVGYRLQCSLCDAQTGVGTTDEVIKGYWERRPERATNKRDGDFVGEAGAEGSLTPPQIADLLRTIELRAGYIIGTCKDMREMHLEAQEIDRLVRIASKGLYRWWHGQEALTRSSTSFTDEQVMLDQQRHIEKLRGLLSVAKCPACDGSGSIPHQVSEDRWEAEQCQWCDERSQIQPADSISATTGGPKA